MAIFALASTVAVTPTPAEAAGPSCAAFIAKVYDQVNPKTAAQSLAARGDQAVVANAAGFTTVRPASTTAAIKSGSYLAAVHRLYKTSTKNYFYSYDKAEIMRATTRLGYVDEGIAFYAATKSTSCLLPVKSYYRNGIHRFTVSGTEGSALKAAGWKEEKVRFYLGKAASVISFAVYPDTQNEVLRDGDLKFPTRTNWVLDTHGLLASRYVMHTGDIANWDTPGHEQYARAVRYLSPLNGKLPYSLAAGNHDTAAVGVGGSAVDPPNSYKLVRDTSTYNTYFRPGMRRTEEFEAGHAENSYSLFEAGGLKWMVLSLELWARPEVIAWAKQEVAAHPHHNVVVVTHSYLTASGTISTSNGGYGATSPKYLYDNLIKQYPNIKLVFSGHTGTAAARRDVGIHGNAIYSYMLTMHSNTTDPTRIVEINATRGWVSSFVYAPLTKTNYTAYYRAPSAISWTR